MLSAQDRFSAPAVGEAGDWIVKLPDAKFPHVPRNEYAMMELARLSGIDVPETRLVHRDKLEAVPANLWPYGEVYAFAVRRFDRQSDSRRIHMEDLAQVRGLYPEEKYTESFETIASLIYRGRDGSSLSEFIRRLTFNIIIRNGDAHLKNWSLLYRDPRLPELSPAYDLVSTSMYRDSPEDLGLRFGRSRRFEDVTLATFAALARKLEVREDELVGAAVQIVDRVQENWDAVRELLDGSQQQSVGSTIKSSSELLRRS